MNTAKKPLCRIHVQGPLREPLPHVISCPYFSIVCDKSYDRDTHLRSAPCSVLPHAFRAHSPLGSQNLKIDNMATLLETSPLVKQDIRSKRESARQDIPLLSRWHRRLPEELAGQEGRARGRGFRPVLAPSVKFGIVDYEFSVPRKLTPRSN
jgi:hypothetical protein